MLMSITCLRLSTNTFALVELKDKLVGMGRQVGADTRSVC